MSGSIPTSKVKRSLIAGQTATKMAYKKLVHFNKRDLERQKILAETLFSGLCQLRGTALKLAQLISTEGDLLPETYIQQLEMAQYRVPPLNKALVWQVLKKEWQHDPKQIFDEFNYEAFAGASLGQVHLAVKNGQKYAVKIQYPGIADTIQNDLYLVKKVMSLVPKNKLIQSSIDELSSKLTEEVDYKIEAQETQWFHDQNTNKNILIPRVDFSLSTSKVLVTTFMPGEHFQGWLKINPSHELKKKVAHELMHFFMTSFLKYKKSLPLT